MIDPRFTDAEFYQLADNPCPPIWPALFLLGGMFWLGVGLWAASAMGWI